MQQRGREEGEQAEGEGAPEGEGDTVIKEEVTAQAAGGGGHRLVNCAGGLAAVLVGREVEGGFRRVGESVRLNVKRSQKEIKAKKGRVTEAPAVLVVKNEDGTNFRVEVGTGTSANRKLGFSGKCAPPRALQTAVQLLSDNPSFCPIPMSVE